MTDPWISCSDLCYQCFSMPAYQTFYQSVSLTFHKGGSIACHMKTVPNSQNYQIECSLQLFSQYCLEREWLAVREQF